MYRIYAFLLGLMLCAGAAHAASDTPPPAPSHEKLLMAPPAGWKLGYKGRDKIHALAEFVPERESVEVWTSLISVQLFYALGGKSPDKMLLGIDKLAHKFCRDVFYIRPFKIHENGYDGIVVTQFCTLNSQSGQGELTTYKIIAGDDRMYVIHKAWRLPPIERKTAIERYGDKIKGDLHYLHAVRLCNDQKPGHPCP